jgi:hypothetical protein
LKQFSVAIVPEGEKQDAYDEGEYVDGPMLGFQENLDNAIHEGCDP